MYGIPGHAPALFERRRRFSQGPEVCLQTDATEDALDSALAASFPASDALSVTQPGGGSRPPMKGGLDNDESRRSLSGLA